MFLNSKNKELEIEKKEKDTLYSKICEFITVFNIDQVRKKKETIERLEDRIDDFNTQVKKLESDLKSNSSKKKLLEGIPCGSAYPNCKFIRDANVAVAGLPLLKQDTSI